MDYILLATTIMSLLQKCRESRDEEPTDDQLLGAARGARGYRAIRKTLRQQGLRGFRLRRAVRREWADVQDMDDDDVLGFIKDAKEDADED